MGQRMIYDASGGVVKTFEYDETENKIVLGYQHDTTPITDRNKQLASLDSGYTSHDRWRRRVASIPYGTLFKWLQKDGISQLRYMRWNKHERNAWLRKHIYDPENWFVLTAPHKTTVNPHLIVR